MPGWAHLCWLLLFKGIGMPEDKAGSGVSGELPGLPSGACLKWEGFAQGMNEQGKRSPVGI